MDTNHEISDMEWERKMELVREQTAAEALERALRGNKEKMQAQRDRDDALWARYAHMANNGD